jgi:hypothetical protein
MWRLGRRGGPDGPEDARRPRIFPQRGAADIPRANSPNLRESIQIRGVEKIYDRRAMLMHPTDGAPTRVWARAELGRPDSAGMHASQVWPTCNASGTVPISPPPPSRALIIRIGAESHSDCSILKSIHWPMCQGPICSVSASAFRLVASPPTPKNSIHDGKRDNHPSKFVIWRDLSRVRFELICLAGQRRSGVYLSHPGVRATRAMDDAAVPTLRLSARRGPGRPLR